MPSVVGRGMGTAPVSGLLLRLVRDRTYLDPAPAFEASSAHRSAPSWSAALMIQKLPSTAAVVGNGRKPDEDAPSAKSCLPPPTTIGKTSSRWMSTSPARAVCANCQLLDGIAGAPRVELANPIFDYVEILHNRQRRHSSLGMLTPIEYENRQPPVA
jgi:Integrase core domain